MARIDVERDAAAGVARRRGRPEQFAGLGIDHRCAAIAAHPHVFVRPEPLEARTRGIKVAHVQRVAMAQAATPAVAMPNPAKLAIRMIPGSPVEIGSNIEFQISSAKRGYVLLVDIDSTGKMTQIFPNPELIERMDDDNINLIRANGRLTVPNEAITKQGFSYRATGPVGATAIVAILSHRKVQLIDLPDMAESGTTAASANRLLKWVGELRIADPHSGKLLPSEWSYDVKSYEIR